MDDLPTSMLLPKLWKIKKIFHIDLAYLLWRAAGLEVRGATAPSAPLPPASLHSMNYSAIDNRIYRELDWLAGSTMALILLKTCFTPSFNCFTTQQKSWWCRLPSLINAQLGFPCLSRSQGIDLFPVLATVQSKQAVRLNTPLQFSCLPACSTAALIATEPNLVAGTEERLPLKDPIGVRTALTMTTSYSQERWIWH